MGQKVHPIGMRVGIIRDWDAKWYAEKEYASYLHEDLAIRKLVQTKLADASVSTIETERAVNKVIVTLHTAKPGMVIGKSGASVDALRAELNALTGKQVHINIVEIKKPDLDAHLVGHGLALPRGFKPCGGGLGFLCRSTSQQTTTAKARKQHQRCKQLQHQHKAIRPCCFCCARVTNHAQPYDARRHESRTISNCCLQKTVAPLGLQQQVLCLYNE